MNFYYLLSRTWILEEWEKRDQDVRGTARRLAKGLAVERRIRGMEEMERGD